MFSKLWSTISDWMGIKNNKPLPRVKKPIHKQRFLIIQDPFQKKVTQKQVIKSKAPQQIPQNAEQLMNYYKLSIIEEENIELEEQKKMDDEFIFDLSKINDALKEIENKYLSIALDSNQISQSIETVLGGIKRANKSEHQQSYIYKKYIRYVEDVVQLKYSGEKIDYPVIQYQNFRQIIQIWERPDDQSLVSGYDYLRYSHLKLLGPSRWLNDQIISEYIGHMNSKLGQKVNNNFVIFNSLKVTSLFDKSDYKKLQKVLQRQKVTKNSALILAIHKVNHWIFLKMQNSLISIYDSLPMQNIQNYVTFGLINKIIKFAEYYYGTPPDVQRITNFPIQKNGNDCGMMMLCGIKDIIRQYKNWSFSQSDLWYKRVLVTKQLLEKKLTGF